MSEHKISENVSVWQGVKKSLQTSLRQGESGFEFSSEWIFLVVVLIGVVTAYGNILGNSFVWDDVASIVESPLLRSFSNIPQFFLSQTDFFYRPYFLTSLASINIIFGPHAFVFHLVSILSHGVISLLVYVMFRKFFRPTFSLFLSLLFAVHPVNTEAVTWASAFSELSYVLYGMLSVFFIFRFLERYAKKNLVLSIFFLVLSYLSKESAVIFSMIIIWYTILFERNRWKHIAAVNITVFGLYILLRFGIARATFLDVFQTSMVPIQIAPFSQRLINIPEILVVYLKTFIFPITLKIQQYWIISSISVKTFFLPLLILIIVGIGFVYLGKMTSKIDKKLHSMFLFFLGWVIFWVLLHIQILPLTMTVAERWFYLGEIGFLGVIGVIVMLYQRTRWIRSRWMIAAVAIIIILLCTRTIIRNTNWKNNYTLYSHDYSYEDNNYSLENNYGTQLFRIDKLDDAYQHFLRSTELAPLWWTNWTNLGTYYEKKGEYQKAIMAYQTALMNRPSYASASYKLSYLLLFMQNLADAEKVAKDGLKYNQNHAGLWRTYAFILYGKKDPAGAVEAMTKAYQFNPSKDNKSLLEDMKNGERIQINK